MNPKKNLRRGRRRSGVDIGSVRTLIRGLNLLDALARLRDATLTDIAEEVGLAASTTYRLLETLRSRGYAHFSPHTGKYRLGVRAFETGYAFLSQTHLKEIADPFMKKVSSQTGETVNLAVLDIGEVVYIHQAEGQNMMRIFTKMGARAPVYCTGVGKCLLAWLNEEEILKHLPTDPFKQFTPKTIQNREAYLKELTKVRRQGCALDDEEREEGVTCVTAPIFSAGGDVVAAISVSGPTVRMQRIGLPSLKTLVKSSAAEIGHSLQGKK